MRHEGVPITRRIGEVGDDGQRDATRGLDCIRGLAQRAREMATRSGLEAPGHQRDRRALGRKPQRDRGADPARRPGDEGNSTGKCITHAGWTIVGSCWT